MDRQRIETREFDNWRKGQVFADVTRMPRNDDSYCSMNMQVYDSGALGPRPRLREFTNTGFTPANNLVLADNSCVQYKESDAAAGDAYGHLYLYSVSVGGASAQAYYYEFDTSATLGWKSASGIGAVTLPNATEWSQKRAGWTAAVSDKVGNSQSDSLGPEDFVFLGQKKWDGSSATAIDWGNGTVINTITNAVFYRGRLWGWSQDNLGKNRLYYTDIDDYTDSDSALQYIDISNASGKVFIKGCWPVRDSLLIALSDDSWYSFTGTPATGTLRFIGKYVTPSHGAAATVLGNAVYFMAPDGQGVCAATPSGVDTITYKDKIPWVHEGNWNIFTEYRALSSPDRSALHLMTVDGSTGYMGVAIEKVNDQWYLTSYGNGTDYFGSNIGTNGYGILRDCATINFGNAYAFLTYGSYFDNSSGTTFYDISLLTRDIILNRPSRDDDVFSSKTDPSKSIGGVSITVGDIGSSALRLSPFSADYGEEARVSRIIIDFSYWRNSDGDYPTPTLKLRIKDATNTTAIIHSDSDSFNTWAASTSNLPNAATNADYRGMQARYVYDLPMGTFHPDMYIELHNIEAIAINKIAVDYEIRPDNFTTRNY